MDEDFSEDKKLEKLLGQFLECDEILVKVVKCLKLENFGVKEMRWIFLRFVENMDININILNISNIKKNKLDFSEKRLKCIIQV